MLKQASTTDVRITVVSRGLLRSFPNLAPRAAAFRLVAVAKANGRTIRIPLDLVLLGNGRADAALMMLGVGKPLPSDFERGLAAVLALRLTR